MPPSRKTSRPASSSNRNHKKGNISTERFKTNAVSQFDKRQARRQENQKLKDDPDVYEYAPGTDHRQRGKQRGNVEMDLDRDEEMLGGGSGSDDEDTQPRLVGEEGIGSDEDEEIDSDDAFEESDEDRFAGFFGPGNKKVSSML